MSRKYLVASEAVEEVILRKGSFKAFCSKISIGKTEYALAMETLKYRIVLETLFTDCNVLIKTLDVRLGMLFVMTYDLLFGKKKINGGGVVKRKILQFQQELKTSLEKLEKQGIFNDILGNSSENISHKYARVNEIKISIDNAIRELHNTSKLITLDKSIPSLLHLSDPIKGFRQ
jgi:hypothetical protein